MPEPAKKIPEEDQPNVRPSFGVIQGGGEGGGPQGNLRSVPDLPSEPIGHSNSDAVDASELSARERADNAWGMSEGDSGTNNGNAETSGFYNPENETEATSGLGSAKASSTADNFNDNFGYKTEKPGNLSNVSGWFGRNKKKSLVGLGMLGLIAGGGIFTASIATGPLQFIHAAQLLQRSHLQTQEDASDRRMGRLYRYATTGNRGETRVGALGSKYANNMRDELKAKGIVVVEGSGNAFKGWGIDTTDEKSPFHGMKEAEVKAKLESMGMFDTSMVSTDESGKIHINPDGLFSRRNSVAVMGKLLGKGKLGTLFSIRSFNKYHIVNFHPMKRTTSVAADKLGERFRTATEKFTSNGEPIDQAMAEDSPATTTPEGKVHSKLSDDIAENAAGEGKGIISGFFSKLGRILNPVSSAEVYVCAANQLYQDMPKLRYVSDILPMMRMAGLTITLGNQIMSGKDVNGAEIAAASKVFTSSSGKNGSQSWTNSQTFLADSGKSSADIAKGQDIDPNMKKLLKGNGKPSYLSWADHSTLCSTTSQIGQAAAGVALTAIPGIGEGTRFLQIAFDVGKSAAGGFIKGVAQSVALEYGIKILEDQMMGGRVNVAASGPEWGNYVNYGSRYLADSQAASVAGVELTPSESSTVNSFASMTLQKQFKSESLASRLFNPYDQRSLVSRAIDNQNPNAEQNIATIFGSITNAGSIFSSTLHTIGSIFTNKAMAVSPSEANNYEYPFPQYGFSEADLSNQAVENPYTNAVLAGKLLDTPCDGNQSPCGQDYIDQAQQCFNVKIFKDSEGVWDVQLGQASPDGSNRDQFDLYSDEYNNKHCSDPSNIPSTDWLRIRFFIFDTSTMNGYGCLQGEGQSCQSDGFDTSTTTTTGTTSDISAYKNPLRDVKNPMPNRVDQGVDYGGDSSPVYAIGNGTVLHTADAGWPGGWFIVYKLDDGPAAGKYVFVAEDCPAVVTIGQRVTSNTVLCNMASGGYSIEMGWASGPPPDGDGLGYAAAHKEYSEGIATSYGQNFNDLLKRLGAKPGWTSGPGVTSVSNTPLPSGWPTW